MTDQRETLYDQDDDEGVIFAAGVLKQMVRDAVRRGRTSNAPIDRVVESILREQPIGAECVD